MKNQEYILCAAIWYKDLPVKKEIPNDRRLPRNIEQGVVFCGHRHPHCLYHMVAIYGLRQCEAGHEVQGFLTNTNRFVTREQAAIIAKQANQIISTHKVETLYSEDLY